MTTWKQGSVANAAVVEHAACAVESAYCLGVEERRHVDEGKARKLRRTRERVSGSIVNSRDMLYVYPEFTPNVAAVRQTREQKTGPRHGREACGL